MEGGELKVRFDGQPNRNVTWRKVLTVRLPEALAQSLAELDAATVSAHVTVLDLTAAELDIETVSGGVYARGGFPQADVSTTSGSAYLSGTFGELDFSTVSGDMTLETNETFRLDAETTSGSVCLRLPEDMGLTLDFASTSGDIRAKDQDHPFAGKKGRLTLGDGASFADITTTSGCLFFD